MRDSDKVLIADHTISNDRLLDILQEKEQKINQLELELHQTKHKLDTIASLYRMMDEICKAS